MRHEIPEVLVDWTENMLAGRNTIVYHGDKTTEGRPDRGCPKGGVLSPPMWCLVADDILQDLQTEGFNVHGYLNNTAFVVSGHFLTTLRDLMENAL